MSGYNLNVLSKRQKQILLMTANGELAKQVSIQVCRSEKTVYSHRERIRKKLGITNAIEWYRLLAWVYETQHIRKAILGDI